MVVGTTSSPRRLPSRSTATATWKSRCVSTPSTTSATSPDPRTPLVVTRSAPSGVALGFRPMTRRTDDAVTGHAAGKLLLGHAPVLGGCGQHPRATDGSLERHLRGPANGWVRPIQGAAHNHL